MEEEGEKIGINFFSDERDIALAFMSNGLCPLQKAMNERFVLNKENWEKLGQTAAASGCMLQGV